MAETRELPVDLIVNDIFVRLPVKSLIRFTCVAKWLRSVILNDPKFAKTQIQLAREHKTLTHRLLFAPHSPHQLKSLDLDTPSSFGDSSSIRNMSFPNQQRVSDIVLLGSLNGLVFVMVDVKWAFVWNPTTGFFKELPDPGFPSVHRHGHTEHKCLKQYGVGYLSATDNYKVFAECFNFEIWKERVTSFSMRANVWTKIERPTEFRNPYRSHGTLVHETLHWLNSRPDEVVAFDLEKDEFRKMRLPNFEGDGKIFSCLGVFVGGCLSLCRYPNLESGACDFIDFWVMREYNVHDSWTKIFKLKYPHLNLPSWPGRMFVMESCTVAVDYIKKHINGLVYADGIQLVRFGHKEGEELGMYMSKGYFENPPIIGYEESLVWINDYDDAAGEKRNRAEDECEECLLFASSYRSLED